MSYNVTERKVFKCDLCGGDPQCARFCEVKAVEFKNAENLNQQKKRNAAARLCAAQKELVV
jgi:Fe-S-cluster-containing hydrogenase component 2